MMQTGPAIAATIADLGVCLPEETLDNQALSRLFPEWSPEKIYDKLGIVRRHISAADETGLDLAERACRRLQAQGQDFGGVDFLILCTQCGDYILPSSSCILQDRLGLGQHVGAFDLGLGCSGYIFGLATAASLLNAGMARQVLLVTADTISKYLSPDDRGNRSIFGDAATATLLVSGGEGRLGRFAFGTDGAGRHNLVIQNGGCRHPGRGGTAAADFLYMNGPEILNFTLETVPPVIRQVLDANAVSMDDIDHVVFHQANAFMLEALRKVIRIPREKFVIRLGETGNTSSSAIPLVLASMHHAGEIRRGSRLLLCGFGVGYSWGATVLTF